MVDRFETWWLTLREETGLGAGLILAAALVLIVVLRLLVFPLLRRAAARTGSTLDDDILDRLQPTVFWTVFLEGFHWALLGSLGDPRLERGITGAVLTLLVLIWGRTVLNIGSVLFERVSLQADRLRWVQPQTLPLVKFVFKVLVFGTQAWLILSAWDVNLTSWLASAGVVGIAVGFAAKDTLANFISGVFILVDAPYEVGQYIIIDGSTRGMVTDIGMRSTRILTRDNVEVTVPNAVIGNAKIVNESSGPSTMMRVRVNVGVAYGSDVDQVKQVLLRCAEGVPHVSDQREPTVRLIELGESALQFQVRVYVEQPEYRGRVVDALNTRIYQGLNAAGIVIPFPQRVVRVVGGAADPAEN